MLALLVECLTYGGKGIGKGKHLPDDEQVRILGPPWMPIDAVGRDRDLGHEIHPGQRHAPRRITRSSSAISCLSRKRQNSSASSLQTVVINRTRYLSARARLRYCRDRPMPSGV
jgi:hypothetical protein